MWPTIFAVVGLGGGALVTFFVMDGKRRDAARELASNRRNRYDLDQDRLEMLRETKRQRKYERDLDERDDNLVLEERKLTRALGDLDRRIAAYALLEDGKLTQARQQVERTRQELERKSQTFSEREAQLFNRVREGLSSERLKFESRVASYTIILDSNRVLRDELIQAGVHSSYLKCKYESLECQLSQERLDFQNTLHSSNSRLNVLGVDYFKLSAAGIERELSVDNLAITRNRIREMAAKLRARGCDIDGGLESQRIDSLSETSLKLHRVARDRAEQSRIREIIREEERVHREAQEQIRQADSERKAIQEALELALGDIGGRHASEIEALRKQLVEAEAKSERARSNAEMGIKHGHVYVISNIGAFGEDVYKIGMTRRTEPLDRVKELSDASVPFPFDVHMMIGCDDAPKLESALHRAFNKKRINKVNPRKEFFHAKFDEILELVKQEHGAVEFVSAPDAVQYRESLTITDDEMAKIDRIYETIDAQLQNLGTDPTE